MTVVLLLTAGASPLLFAQDNPAPPPAAPPAATQPSSGPSPRIEVSEPEISFGTVWQGEPLKHDITLKNSGVATLKILDVSASCGCTRGELGKNELAPGESTSFSISVDSLKRKGDLETYVSVKSNDPANFDLRVKVKAFIKPVFDITPSASLAFGRVGTSDNHVANAEITSFSETPVELKLGELKDGDNFDVSLEEVEKGKRWKVIARTKPPMKVGFLRSTAIIKTGHDKMPELQIPISCSVAARVTFSPTVLYVAPSVKNRTDNFVRVQFSASQPLNIKEVKVTGDAGFAEKVTTEVVPLTRKPTGQTFITQMIRVKMPDDVEVPEAGAAIEILTDDAEFARISIPVQKAPVTARKVVPRTLPLTSQAATGPVPPAGAIVPAGQQRPGGGE
ncbi:MAG: hypothetical protein CHACPFDD_01672 [Phycisphaerae bacterium]|nr:hypothetical protein [Phycisphaerae bacterium]